MKMRDSKEQTESLIDRYPGPKPFDEIHSPLFFGRTQEIKELFDSIVVNQTLLLHGESGLGKSSLINAGLVPKLKAEGYRPFLFRFKEQKGSPLSNILTEITPFIPSLALLTDVPQYHLLWIIIKELNLQGDVPVLIIDQFEEFSVFDQEDKNEFYEEIVTITSKRSFAGDLIEPATFAPGANPDWYEPINFKLVISIRSDKLMVMEELGHHIPELFRNRYRLKPIQFKYAKQLIVLPAVTETDGKIEFKTPPFSIAENVTNNILEVIKDQNNSIETTQLQMICQDIEAYVRGSDLSGQELLVTDNEYPAKKIKDIPKNFYKFKLKKIREFARNDAEYTAIRVLIEQRLLVDAQKTPMPVLSIKSHFSSHFEKYRGRLKHIMTDYSASIKKSVVIESRLDEIISFLLETRLIRDQPYGNTIFYEISHDVLIPGILEGLDEFKKQENKARYRKKTANRIFVFTLGYAIITLFILMFFQWSSAKRTAQNAIGESEAKSAAADYKSGNFPGAFNGWRKASTAYNSKIADKEIATRFFPVLAANEFTPYHSERIVALIMPDKTLQFFDISTAIPKSLYKVSDASAAKFTISSGGRFMFLYSKVQGNLLVDLSKGKSYPIKLAKQSVISNYGFFGNDSYFFYQYDQGFSFFALPGNTSYSLKQIEKVNEFNPIKAFNVSADGRMAYVDKGESKFIFDMKLSQKVLQLPKSTIGFNFHKKLPVYYYIVNRTSLYVTNYKTKWHEVLKLPRPSFVDEIDDRLIVKNPRAYGRIGGVGINFQYSYAINLKTPKVYEIPLNYYKGNIIGLSTEKYFLFKKDHSSYLHNVITSRDTNLDKTVSNCLTDNKRNLVYYLDNQSMLNVYHLDNDRIERISPIQTQKFTLNKDRSLLAFQRDSASRVGLFDVNTKVIKYVPVDGLLDKFIGHYLQLNSIDNSDFHKILLDPENVQLTGTRKMDYLSKIYKDRRD